MRKDKAATLVALAILVFPFPIIAEQPDPWFEDIQPSQLAVEQHAPTVQPPQPPSLPDTNKGMAAIARAQSSDRYLFLFFLSAQDEPTLAMWNVFQTTMSKVANRADALGINILDPNEQPVVKYFNVSRAPMPLVIALAPNGAVMGGFPTSFTEAQLLGSFGTPAMEQALRGLQMQKLVFICIQNQQTQSNEAALYGVNEVKADPQFAQATEVVFLNPADPNEAKFLAQLEIDPTVTAAQTVMMVPPGSVLGKFMAGTTKSMILSKIQASGACGPGGVCGPGGCGPAKGGPTASSSSQPQPQKKGIVAKVKSMFGN
ncbi:MAG: hypothetical protein KC917_06025 [Candidatus Omnitrophica bacterium]|nr:hypothetical protein [Candidatus Omnitrophota bacterium]